MTSIAANDDRVMELAGAVCNRTASKKDLAELKSLLLLDQASRHRYLLYCIMHAALRFQARADDAARKISEQLGVAPVQHSLPPSDVSTPGFHSTAFHIPLAYLSSSWPLAYLIATVIMGIGALIGSFTYVSQPVQVARELPVAVKDHVANPLQKKFVGRITGMVDCMLEKTEGGKVAGEEKTPRSQVLLGDTFSFASGLLEITYQSGAKVVLQGPVTYRVDSVDGGFLSAGKLTALVEKKVASGQRAMGTDTNSTSTICHSPSAISSPQSLISNSSLATHHQPLFTISTPTATVTDLGTEFGVEVNDMGTTETQVFVGSVKITPLGDDRERAKAQVIHAGSAIRIDGNGKHATAIQPNAGRFVRSLQSYSQDVRNEAYAKFVLSLNPVVYYRMEEWPKIDKDDCYMLIDSAAGHHHGELYLDRAFGPPEGHGKFGGGLQFRGPMVDSYTLVPDYPKTESGRLSVSAWVYPRAFFESFSSIVSNLFAIPPCQGQFSLENSGTSGLSAIIRQETGVPVAVFGHALLRNEWQHVAFVADGSVLRLYRNGIEVATQQYFHGIAHQAIPKGLGIGCYSDLVGPNHGIYNSRNWIGCVDEIAIFNDALTAEQVRELYTGPKAVSAETSQKQGKAAKSEKKQEATVVK